MALDSGHASISVAARRATWISAALESVLAAIPGRPWKEATIEAAPGTITREKAAAWRRIRDQPRESGRAVVRHA